MTGGAGGLRFARPAFFLLLLLAASAAAAEPWDAALAKAREARLWEDARWLAMGHWRPAGRSKRKSDADRGGFFLAPEGRTDPRAELEAMTRGLYAADPGAEKQHPRCRFPLRTRWLLEKLGDAAKALPSADCSRFEDWRRQMDAGGVSLIFASAYLNNPASMFGHTFLRMERRRNGEAQRLIDNTLNYAADTGDEGGALFALKGLLGLYPGKYTVQPFYMMVQQYNNIESRDLWEYRLNLSSAEVDDLVAHAWEMGGATFPYFFTSKNCSYQLLPALEAVLPGRRLLAGSPAVVAPVETVQAVLDQPGLVSGVEYRPSHATTMIARRGLLSRGERRSAEALMRGDREAGERALAALPPDRQALVLDSAEEYLLYKEGHSPDAPPDVRERERRILLRRAKLDAPSVEPARPASAQPPEQGHKRSRLRTGAGARSGGSFLELAWRPAYHDLLDAPQGFVPGAEVESLAWRLRFQPEDRRLFLEEFKVVEAFSVSPWDPWVRKPSWIGGTGLETAHELEKDPARELVYEAHVGSGLAAQAGPAMAWALAVAESAAGPGLRDGFRAGGSLRFGAAADLSRRWRALAEGSLTGFAWGDKTPAHKAKIGLNYAWSRDLALRTELALRGHYREGGLYAVLYH